MSDDDLLSNGLEHSPRKHHLTFFSLGNSFECPIISTSHFKEKSINSTLLMDRMELERKREERENKRIEG